jgi:hypothetical protein
MYSKRYQEEKSLVQSEVKLLEKESQKRITTKYRSRYKSQDKNLQGGSQSSRRQRMRNLRINDSG